jgi:hypothetical protein
MSAQRRLTEEQIAYARRVAEIKRRIVQRLKRYPTVEQMAEQIGCDARYLEKIIAGDARKVPRKVREL